MKNGILLLFIFSCFIGYAQKNSDAIVGKWLKTPKEDLIIEVYEVRDKYNGKISWSKNNDKKKKSGFVILDNLSYNPKSKKWVNGTIHDPNSGKTYSAEVKLKPDGNLQVRGFKGMKLLGASKIFRRVK